MCQDKRNWDDEITAEVGLVWASFLHELTDLKEVRAQRLVWSGISGRQKRVELHGFSDSTVGDVVLTKDDEPVPRCKGRLGKISQLVVGRDGQVRGAKLKAISKGGQQTTMFRLIQKLVPFEIVEVSTDTESPEVNENSAGKDENDRRTEPVEGQNLRRLREQLN